MWWKGSGLSSESVSELPWMVQFQYKDTKPPGEIWFLMNRERFTVQNMGQKKRRGGGTNSEGIFFFFFTLVNPCFWLMTWVRYEPRSSIIQNWTGENNMWPALNIGNIWPMYGSGGWGFLSIAYTDSRMCDSHILSSLAVKTLRFCSAEHRKSRKYGWEEINQQTVTPHPCSLNNFAVGCLKKQSQILRRLTQTIRFI